MSTLIIPCAGKSSRFPNMKPKWLLLHPDGEIMVQKAISGLNLNQFERVIFTVVKEHIEQFEADVILNQIFDFVNSSKFELFILDEFTSCQAETVYLTLIGKDIKGKFAVKDSDNYIGTEVPDNFDFVLGININNYDKEIYRLKQKSFLIINKQGIITDIIEKSIKSELICIGLYGFSDAHKFIKAYEHINNENSNFHEIYLSHIISYLIGTKKSVYKCVETVDYEDWGTLSDWAAVLKRYSTYFINIDGVLIEDCGKYGSKNWSNSCIAIENNINIVKQLADNGAQIIFTTSRDELYEPVIKEIFDRYQIKFYEIITNCNYSPQILINSFYNSKPFPTSYSINLELGADLEKYIG